MAEKKESSATSGDIARREGDVLAFWQKNNIFKKSEEKEAPKGEFVFYDGPPFATGLPHSGSLLSSIIKDVIPRYKTMQGYYVRRRWGWDCHGLPIENMVEKELGLKTKRDIEAMGVEKFNQACRDAVLRCERDWKHYVDRIGRWVHFDDSYKTMDNTFMESVWWGLKEIYNKNLLYEGRKVLLYCPHCETPLAKAEIAQDNSYKDTTEEAVTVKFEVKESKSLLKQGDYFLAWTTTPWTLPGNVALAVSEKEEYAIVDSKKTKERFVVAKSLLGSVLGKDWEQHYNLWTTQDGKNFVDTEYEPLFEISAVQESGKKSHYVAPADFVTAEEGTGIVHTAVMYGEDDYELGLKLDLPQVQLLSSNGHFNDRAPESIRGEYFKKAEKIIKDDLENRNLLFARADHTHSYPHCHRCGTALLYNALSSWFINVQKIKEKLIKKNNEINWVPKHLKEGRFLHTLSSAPDWTISRNRYWASPLPIWKNASGDPTFIGSIEELKQHTKTSGNHYFIMRHGEAENNVLDILNADSTKQYPLTEKGIVQVKEAIKKLREHKINIIVHSPLQRVVETAHIIAKELSLSSGQVKEEQDLREVTFGAFEGETIEGYRSYFSYSHERLTKPPQHGETWTEVKNRITKVLYRLEDEYQGKNILIISHNGPLQMLQAGAQGLDVDGCATCIESDSLDLDNAETRELPFIPLPHNQNYELDLHRPYIDDIALVNKKGEKLTRVSEVIDGWVESGSMPFAEYHYPFENKKIFKQRRPADFIAEYIGQTRTWFYYLHVLATALFNDIAFRNVVTTGNILAEDGSKMSKSKKNYTDPLELVNEFGADAYRYYLMKSVVMRAEDLRFTDNDVKEIKNRLVAILFNVFNFYSLYKDQLKVTKRANSDHVLDRWILSRLYELRDEVTKSLDDFNTVKAAVPIREFVTDLSTWYIRRSRDRLKGDDGNDKQNALATTQLVLSELSKIIAPFMPFLAELIYQGVKEKDGRESVHLEDWPRAGEIDTKLLTSMALVRKIVSSGLEARDAVRIKIRQPLSELRIKNQELRNAEEYLALIEDELNVKDVVFDQSLGSEVALNTEVTPELKEEGLMREFIRKVQELRKKLGFTPQDVGLLTLATDDTTTILLKKYEKDIVKTTKLQPFVFKHVDSEEVIQLEDKIVHVFLVK